MELFPQIFEVPREHFRRHLDLEENHRILFSGRFGVGKTTFLKHFFEDSAFAEKYNCFHLYPVNYSILENADIMSYLKYDILHELLIHHGTQVLTEPKGGNTHENAVIQYGIRHFSEIIALLVLAIPKLGKQYFQLIQEWKKMKGVYESYLENVPQSEEYKAISDFFENFHETEGDLYEENFVTQIITNALESMKGDDENPKENVLILDDLDRIDPQHIFRLFNVFTAQFDQHNTGNGKDNKFGFDKVIFVCNVDNIRSIFHHFYGTETNFNGYIDKFYSKEVFRFDNKENLAGIMSNVINNLNITNEVGGALSAELLNNIIKPVLNQLFLDIVNSGYVNLREFFRHEQLKINIKGFNFDGVLYSGWSFHFIYIIEVLLLYFGDVEYLKKIIAKTKQRPNAGRERQYFEYSLLVLSDMENHRFKISTEDDKTHDFEYTINEANSISYNLKKHHYKDSSYVFFTKINDEELVNKLDFYELLLKAIENLEKVKYFN